MAAEQGWFIGIEVYSQCMDSASFIASTGTRVGLWQVAGSAGL